MISIISFKILMKFFFEENLDKIYYGFFEFLNFMKKILFIFLMSFSVNLFAQYLTVEKSNLYMAKNYSYLLTIDDFDKSLMKMHITLYEGYVNNVNLRIDQLDKIDSSSRLSKALKKTFAFEFDGMKLHELYFDNLKQDIKINRKSKFYKKIEEQFESFDTWINDFKNTGMIRGIGWVILYFDVNEKRFFNAWIDEHQINHLIECVPILVMDVFEHAYLTQFGLNRKKYIDIFFKNINWYEVSKRYEKVIK
ncbi:MAG: Superoxide dismutase [Fe] [Candidatus Anoxychlamydiales bacterium]|nr:Superoxide dismutase [Fe] [Candidatus Anoxychlamydiales bacterium]